MVPFLMLKAIIAPLWKIALVKSASLQLDG